LIVRVVHLRSSILRIKELKQQGKSRRGRAGGEEREGKSSKRRAAGRREAGEAREEEAWEGRTKKSQMWRNCTSDEKEAE